MNKITGHLEKWDPVAFSISVTSSELISDGSSTVISFVYLCVVVPRLMQKETKIHNSWG